MQTVRLKNGTEELGMLVQVTMLSLRNLVKTDPILFYEVVMTARDPAHPPWGNAPDRMAALGFLDPAGRMHSSIRNIVLSAATGEMLEMSLGSPIAEPA